MEDLDLILLIAMVAPLSMMIPVVRGRLRETALFLAFGMFMCIFAGEINGLIFNMTDLSRYVMTINVTPAVEEVLKGIPILVFAFLFNPERKTLLQCALCVGVGFAIIENIHILGAYGESLTINLAVIRGFGAGMMHGICTMMVGYAMSFVNTKRKLFYTGTFAALSMAIIYHSIYNCMVQSQYEAFAIVLPILTYIPLIIFIMKREKR